MTRSEFAGTAFRSNCIAFGYTCLIIATWYAFEWGVVSPSLFNLLCLLGLVVLSRILQNLQKARRIGFLPSLDLTTDAQQWAPIAGASMVVGWGAGAADYCNKEAVMLLAIGILYSYWCIGVASEAKHPEPVAGSPASDATDSRIRLGWRLFLTHLLAPIFIFACVSYLVHEIFSPVARCVVCNEL